VSGTVWAAMCRPVGTAGSADMMIDRTGWFEDAVETWQRRWRDAAHALYGTRAYTLAGDPVCINTALPAAIAREWHDHGSAPRQALTWYVEGFTRGDLSAWASALLEDDHP